VEYHRERRSTSLPTGEPLTTPLSSFVFPPLPPPRGGEKRAEVVVNECIEPGICCDFEFYVRELKFRVDAQEEQLYDYCFPSSPFPTSRVKDVAEIVVVGLMQVMTLPFLHQEAQSMNSPKASGPFLSTRGGGRYTFKSAVLSGWASDGGMILPETVPKITIDQLKAWRGTSDE